MPSPTTWSPASFFDVLLVPNEGANVLAGVKWGGAPGSPVEISFSFAALTSAWSTDPATGYGPSSDPSGEPWNSGFAALNLAAQEGARSALSAFSAVAGIEWQEIVESASLVGDVRFAFTGSEPDAVVAHAYLPAPSARAGDIWLNADHAATVFADLQPGSNGYLVLLHEIGHALGLKHSFEGFPSLPEVHDHLGNTVMSYSVKPGLVDDGDSASFYPTTPMRFDILALQYLYGANLEHNSGDDTYAYAGDQPYWQTLWDTGGIDTISYDSAADGAVIDLTPGSWSRLGLPILFEDATSEERTVFIFDAVMIEHARGGAGNDSITGNTANNRLEGSAGADTMTGWFGDDTLDGGSGIDSMNGFFGADVYYVDNAADLVVELAGPDIDTVYASVSYVMDTVLGNFAENLILTGTQDLSATGSSLTNLIVGNPGNNLIDGRGAAVGGGGPVRDTLMGGLGDDIYQSYSGQDGSGSTVEVAHDTIIENPDEGTDEVRSDIGYTLGANLENLRLQGAGGIAGHGNALANFIWGNSGGNLLDGGAGADTLAGGAGDDVYVIDQAGDAVQEVSGEGIDRVQSAISYSLGAAVENLLLTGGAAQGEGNALANALTGNAAANVLSGFGGSDTLDGGGGADALAGGAGDDVYFVDDAGDSISEGTSEGHDEVRASVGYTLSAETEALVLLGIQGIDGTGNSGANRLTGNLAGNVLDGGAGADTMAGGAGDDTYIVDDAGDVVDESIAVSVVDILPKSWGGGGEPPVISADGRYVAFRANSFPGDATVPNDIVVRDLHTGELRIASTDQAGNQLASPSETPDISADGRFVAFRNSGQVHVKDLQTGALTLASSTAGGTAVGGERPYLSPDGRLVSFLTNSDIVIKDLGTGALTWLASGSIFSSVDFSADNRLVAFDAFDHPGLDANGLPDVFVKDLQTGAWSLASIGASGPANGGSSNAVISAGGRYVAFQSAASNLVAGDTNGAVDVFVKDLHSGAVVRVSVATDGTQANSSSLNPSISDDGRYVAFTSHASNLVAGDADGQADTFVADLLTGQLVRVDQLPPIQNGVFWASTISGDGRYLAGSGFDPAITDERVVVVSNAGADTLGSESVIAQVSYALSQNVENLVLAGSALDGTGNALANALTGNASDNELSGLDGDDTLDGGAGSDVLDGGAGDDTYLIDALDTISDSAGVDIVYAGFSYTLGAGLENLVLTGSDPISGTGNASANAITGNSAANALLGGAVADTLTGGGGDDTLNGGGGADIYIGGSGNDLYVVDGQESITELAGEGDDVVNSSASHSLQANVEILNLTGAAAINGTGNNLINRIKGNSAANTIDGGILADQLYGQGGNDVVIGGGGNDGIRGEAGNDTLTGGAGVDSFIFLEAAGAANADLVTDFVSGTDLIKIENSSHAGIGAVGAVGTRFASGAGIANGLDANDRILYDTASGALYYDSNGSGAGGVSLIATFQGAPNLIATDITVV